MAANKIEKALYGPSMIEVIFGAILGLIVGVVAACVYLVFKPVLTVREMPKAPVANTVYYLPGVDSKAKSKDWQVKQKQFLAGGKVQLVEDELNAWASTLADTSSTTSAAPAKPTKPGEKPAKPVPEGFVIPAKPNFRIHDGKLQIGTQCTLNWYGLMTDVTVQATGVLLKEGDMFVFVPESVYLGSCPLHYLPMVPGLLLSHLTSAERVTDDLRAAWAKLSDARIDGSTLKLGGQ